MFRAWWYPFSHYGVIHGDPHLGNYSVFAAEAGNGAAVLPAPGGINLASAVYMGNNASKSTLLMAASHRAFIDAISSGDPEAAAAEVHEHMGAAADNLTH